MSGPSRDNPDVIVHDLYEPCAPRKPGAMEMTWLDVEGEKLKEPLVSMVSCLYSYHYCRNGYYYTVGLKIVTSDAIC